MLSQTQHTPAQSCPLLSSSLLEYFKNIFICIYLVLLGLSCDMQDLWTLHWRIQDLSLWHVRSKGWTPNQRWNPCPLPGAQSLGHWTIKQVPPLRYYPSPPYLFTESGYVFIFQGSIPHMSPATISCAYATSAGVGHALLMVPFLMFWRGVRAWCSQARTLSQRDSWFTAYSCTRLNSDLPNSPAFATLRWPYLRHRITADVIS